VLAAKRSLVSPTEERLEARGGIDLLAKLFSPRPQELADERAEHLDIYTLVGDPLLRLRYPRAMELTAPKLSTIGDEITISGVSPLSGKCAVELVVPRGTLRFTAPLRSQFEESPAAQAAYNETYRRANDPCWVRTEFEVREGAFTAKLTPPLEAKGACHVRAFVIGRDDCAAGAAIVEIQSLAEQASRAAAADKVAR
jgi:hypothetical protein